MSQDHCPNRKAFRLLDSSLDRLQEAAWFIRLMEDNYHQSERFRWSLNSFLRALKEVIQVLTMEVQKSKIVSIWLKQEKNRISSEPLIDFLFKQRDIIVHREMLKPASKGSIGYTRGRGLKIGLGMPIDTMANSETAIRHY